MIVEKERGLHLAPSFFGSDRQAYPNLLAWTLATVRKILTSAEAGVDASVLKVKKKSRPQLVSKESCSNWYLRSGSRNCVRYRRAQS